MASTTIVDYQVLTDGAFTLDAGTPVRDETLSFAMPSDFVLESGVRRPILAFKVRPDEDSSFTVFVNAREVASFDLSQSVTRGYWEPFSANTAFPEGSRLSDNVPVRFLINSGRVILSDVVLWYQIRR